MKKFARIGMVAAATFAAVATSASAASAAPSGDPNVTRVATPAHACASIPGTLAQFGVTPEGFSYSDCVRTLARGVPDIPEFGAPAEQCDVLVQFGVISYPFVFHAEPGDPFPDLRANNREQCARALYAFHTIESYAPAPPQGN